MGQSCRGKGRTGARFAREKQVPRSHLSGQRTPVGGPGCVRNDSQKNKGNSKGKG
jgi:hypothetical protein